MDDDVEKLKVYESANGISQDYILLQDVERNNMTLAKGERVRIIIVTNDEWIKVYAYKASDDILKSVRFLILHMFNDDFPESKFDREKFDVELAKIVAKAGTFDDKDIKEDKKKPVKKEKKQAKNK